MSMNLSQAPQRLKVSSFVLEKLENGNYFLKVPMVSEEEYKNLVSKFDKIGGKYKKIKKDKGFVFDTNPTVFLKAIDEGKSVDFFKDTQFYETPTEMWLNIMKLCNEYRHFGLNEKILEPSAGRGSFINSLLRYFISYYGCFTVLDYKIHCIEKNDINLDFLINRFKLGIWRKDNLIVGHGDFIDFSTDNQYDWIFANPPFAKGQAALHLKKIVQHLRPDGIAAVILPYDFSNKKSVIDCVGELPLIDIIKFPKGMFKRTAIETVCVIVSKTAYTKHGEPLPESKFYYNKETDQAIAYPNDGSFNFRQPTDLSNIIYVKDLNSIVFYNANGKVSIDIDKPAPVLKNKALPLPLVKSFKNNKTKQLSFF